MLEVAGGKHFADLRQGLCQSGGLFKNLSHGFFDQMLRSGSNSWGAAFCGYNAYFSGNLCLSQQIHCFAMLRGFPMLGALGSRNNGESTPGAKKKTTQLNLRRSKFYRLTVYCVDSIFLTASSQNPQLAGIATVSGLRNLMFPRNPSAQSTQLIDWWVLTVYACNYSETPRAEKSPDENTLHIC